MSFALFMQIVALIVISLVIWVGPFIIFAKPMLRWMFRTQADLLANTFSNDEDFDQHSDSAPGMSVYTPGKN